MSEPLEPGTICYLVKLRVMTELLGRAVEVVAGPMFSPDDDADWVYSVTASWVRERFPGGMLSPRKYLQPIVPPDGARDEAQPTQLDWQKPRRSASAFCCY